MNGVLIAAPGSGAGKTTITLALLRLLSRRGMRVCGAKSGPDYIDPKFHESACGAPCPNLDAWAMHPDRLRALAQNTGGDLLVVEGAMGLFDGAPPNGAGSAADLAKLLQLPVILVVNASHMAQSVAALVAGFVHHDRDLNVAAVILNNVGSVRHDAMLRAALAPLGLPILASLFRRADLALPSRHLGLVQASERADLDLFLDKAADALEDTLDFDALLNIAAPVAAPTAHFGREHPAGIAPPAQIIAVAQDRAFAFCYPHLLDDWRRAGAEIRLFSPLANDPVPEAGFVYLPGGYPELHGGVLAAADTFINSLKKASQSIDIYGECGGYMALGEVIIDANGVAHEMAGLLNLETSFAKRKIHLGYRDLVPLRGPFIAQKDREIKAHEFHYATTVCADGPALFRAQNAEGADLGEMGLSNGRVHGSFVHIIDIK